MKRTIGGAVKKDSFAGWNLSIGEGKGEVEGSIETYDDVLHEAGREQAVT